MNSDDDDGGGGGGGLAAVCARCRLRPGGYLVSFIALEGQPAAGVARAWP